MCPVICPITIGGSFRDNQAAMSHQRPQFWNTFWRSWRLRCPVCGQGKLFRGWFRMHKHCDVCGTQYEREPGYFLGSIYFNYGVTALLFVTVFSGLMIASRLAPQSLPRMLHPTSTELRCLLAAFAILFPIWFFRYARSLWLGLDQYFDPLPMDDPETTADMSD